MLCLGLGGCLHSSDTVATGQRATSADNTRDFDRYVEQRTSSLLAMGATRDSADAPAQATLDAASRYGLRVAAGDVGASGRAAPGCTARLRRPRPGRKDALTRTVVHRV